MTETRKITLQFPSLRAFLAEYGERISTDGMLLRSEAPPASGSTVDIEVVVAEGMRLLRARGETLWSGAASGDGRQAAAIRFDELDDASRTLIGKIVDQRRRAGAEPFDLAHVPGPREARLRELTVPAAQPSASLAHGGAGEESVFDLAAPPAEPIADLFSPQLAPVPAAAGAPTAVEEEEAAEGAAPAAEPAFGEDEAGPETPAVRRERVPPVPLLADPGPAPFDLSGAEPDATGLLFEPDSPPAVPVSAEGRDEHPAGTDLNDLFGEEGPGVSVSGRTEAFPPSFLDEVEAELEAADGIEGSFLEVDTGELEVQRDAPSSEPPAGERQVPEKPVEAAPEVAAPLAAEPPPRPVAPSAAEPLSAPGELGAADAHPARSAATAAAAERVEPASIPPAVGEAADGSSPSASPAPEAEELESRVNRAFVAAHGPETVEIPILRSSDPVEQPVAGSVAAELDVEPPPPDESLGEEPPVVVPPPSAAIPAVRATPPPPLDDNLLSIPELGREPAAESAAAPVEPPELASSSRSLRGAARSSRQLGTWLLIALLAGALAVAGYLIFGLARGDVAAAPEPPLEASRTATPVPADEMGDEGQATPTDEEPSPVVETGGTAAAAAAEELPPAATETAPEPPAALTALSRITWSESAAETILVLVANGAISRSSVELIPIAGDAPRLLIKISGVQRAFQPAVLEVGTEQVQRVRTGLHPGAQLHVVVDLAAAGISVRGMEFRGSRVEVRLGAG